MDDDTGRPSNKQKREQEESVWAGGGDPTVFSNGTYLDNNKGI